MGYGSESYVKRNPKAALHNRAVAVALSIIMLFSSMAVLTRGTYSISTGLESRFSDYQNHWAGKFIADLLSEGIVSDLLDGNVAFEPESLISRAETAELLLKINLPGGFMTTLQT